MIARYNSSTIMWALDGAPLTPDANGEWVRYSDHLAARSTAPEAGKAVDELIAERDALKLRCENLAAIVEDRMKDTRLVSAGGRGEGFGFDLMGGPIPYIAEYLVQFMGLREGAETNYSEIEVQHNEFGALTLTIQRRSGKTPHQLRKEAEAEATSLRRKLEEQEIAEDTASREMQKVTQGLRDRATAAERKLEEHRKALEIAYASMDGETCGNFHRIALKEIARTLSGASE